MELAVKERDCSGLLTLLEAIPEKPKKATILRDAGGQTVVDVMKEHDMRFCTGCEFCNPQAVAEEMDEDEEDEEDETATATVQVVIRTPNIIDDANALTTASALFDAPPCDTYGSEVYKQFYPLK
jgi:hypothetical protein